MRRPEAILFDNDLTLCDTFPSIFGGFNHALSLVGIKASEDVIRDLMGVTLRVGYQKLLKDQDLELLIKAHNEFQVANPHLITSFKNTRWAINRLHSVGIKIGVVTNRYGELLYRMLRDAGIYGQLGAIVTNHDVDNPKPHPEHALKALKILGAKPENSWIVGDDDVDITCGRDAGLTTVGAMWSHPDGKEWKIQPDHLAYDIGDVVLPAVMGEEYFNQDFS